MVKEILLNLPLNKKAHKLYPANKSGIERMKEKAKRRSFLLLGCYGESVEPVCFNAP